MATKIILEDQFNDAFRPSDVVEPLKASLSRCWNKNSQSGLALSSADLDNIQEARDAALDLINAYFERIVETANRRRNNLLKFDKVMFISVGEDCFSRTLLTRWGFKAPAKLGEKSSPFDLAIHPLASTVKLIENRFNDYLDIEKLAFDDQLNVASNTLYNVLFNHEVGSDAPR